MLRRYISVALLSRAADAGIEPAVLLCAAAAGMSPAEGALVLGAMTVTAAVGGPVTGAVIDRCGRAGPAYATGLAVIGLGALGLALSLHALPLPALLLIAGLAGTAQPLFSGGWTAQLSRLVPQAALQRAYAVDAVTYDLGAIAGPALAGALLITGDRMPLVAMAVLALTAVPVVLGTSWPQPPRSDGALLDSVRTGLGTLVRNRRLRTVTVLSTLQYAGMAGRTVAAPLLAQRITGHAAFAGALFAFSAGASLAGSALLTRIRLAWPPERVAAVITALTAVALGGLALTSSPWLATALFAACGLLDAPLLTSVFTVRGEQSPEHLRAQIFATAASIKTSAYAVAVMLFGLAVQHGVRTCLLLGAAVQVAGLACTVRRRESAPAVT